MNKNSVFAISVMLVLVMASTASAFSLWDWITGKNRQQQEMDFQVDATSPSRQVMDRDQLGPEVVVIDSGMDEPLVLNKKIEGYDDYDKLLISLEEEGTPAEEMEEDEDYPDPNDYPGVESYVTFHGDIEFEDIMKISYTMDPDQDEKYIIYLTLFMQDNDVNYYPQFHPSEHGKLHRLDIVFDDYEEAQSMYYMIKDAYLESQGSYPNFMNFVIRFRSTECTNKKYLSPGGFYYEEESYSDDPQFILSTCKINFDGEKNGDFTLETTSSYAYKVYYD